MTAPPWSAGTTSGEAYSPEERAAALQASVAPDLYTANTFVPWHEIDKALDRSNDSVMHLQQLVDEGTLTQSALAEWLIRPSSVWVARTLFAAPQPVGFSDGRQLPDDAPATTMQRNRLAGLLLTLGLERLLPPGARVVDLVRVGALSMDARKRGFRRRDRAQKSLATLVQEAAKEAAEATGLEIKRLPTYQWPAVARGRASAVVAVADQPVAAVVDVFQAQAGGRQRRDLLDTYPALQRELDRESISLIVLLNGRGIQQAPRRVLATLIEQVAACMSAREAQQGGLTQSLVDAASRSGLRRGAVRGFDVLIRSTLGSASSIAAKDLPGSEDQALLAMGDYISQNPNLALALNASSGTLAWEHPEATERLRSLAANYNPSTAVEALTSLLSLKDLAWLPAEDEVAGAFGTLSDPVLPERLLIAAADANLAAIDVGLLRRVGRLNRMRDDGGRLALLVVPPGTTSSVTHAEQRTLATSVVIVDTANLRRASEDKYPRGVLLDLVLQQADLTKANPFTVMGVAGSGVFYGRGQEDSMLQNTVRTNSAALIGGRRIGKTSLMQHARARLIDAGFNVQFADCQAVDSWQAFAEHAELHWQVQADSQFTSGAVEQMVAQLQATAPGQLVIMLDEVDNLLRWDRDYRADGMNEPFFRTLRSLSQEGSCQFVFSGERLIARVLRDAGSPHWNFCRAIPIRQLNRDDALALFSNPIAALGVEIRETAESLDHVWRATSGHPQLVQQLGENVVNLLNDRPAEQRRRLTPSDVEEAASDPDFLRHYVRTYWGQANPVERLTTAVIVEGASTIDEIMHAVSVEGADVSLDDLQGALRMLDLYGIIDESGSGIEWRAINFPTALEALGGARLTIEDCVRQLK